MNGPAGTVAAHPWLARIPERIRGLGELAYNLWWSWHPEARILFKQINQHAWKESIHNPVRMLQEIPVEFLEKIAENPDYLRRYDISMFRFRQYMSTRNGWFSESHPSPRALTIAYFSAEYGLHHSLPLYAGGLGFLAGDYLKECSDLGVPLVAVGFMYSEGYLTQRIRPDGTQDDVLERLNRDAAPVSRVTGPDGNQLVVTIPLISPPIRVAVWRVDVGKVPLFLLDTDIPENDPRCRSISSRLYTGKPEERLVQEIVLGIGGWKVLDTLGITFSAIHLNEGHPAFALLEMVRERVSRGLSFREATEQVRGIALFTTHTPLPSATDVYPPDLMDRYFSGYYPALGIDRETFLSLGRHPRDPTGGFNMTVFALRMTAHHNAVSARHAGVSKEIWRDLWPDLPPENVPIDSITNGVHLSTWINPRLLELVTRYMLHACPDWYHHHDTPELWEMIDEIPDAELWKLHVWLKNKLIHRIRERARMRWAAGLKEPANLSADGLMLNPSVLTIGFARRFSGYKRADLIFHDVERLKGILTNRWWPVQIIFAGKAHPCDHEGQEILRRVYRFAASPEFQGRIAFVEDYGEQTAQYLVHGVDVWLNNPLPPMEACGTSGMKAAVNGVLNLSIRDGWWLEGYNGRNGWAFGGKPWSPTRNAEDAAELYDILEREVVPLYYDTSLDGIPHGWVRMMKESIKSVAPRFSARRMVKEYIGRYYPSLISCAERECRVPLR
ncbi:MAG: alpha-glucan family phosphorylase [Methanolinea sp.]|nr:alpha-glucan family phosphorylase [Methanolinea sp.]